MTKKGFVLLYLLVLIHMLLTFISLYIFWFCSTIHLAQKNYKENTKHLSITSSSQIQFPHLSSLLAFLGLQAGMEEVWKLEELKVEKVWKVEVDEVMLVPQSPQC